MKSNWFNQVYLATALFFIIFDEIATVTILPSTLNCGVPKVGQQLIFGGFATPKGAYPWNAALLRNNKDFFCGGTLVSNKAVVTAANCLKGKHDSHEFNPTDFYVLLGAHNILKSHEIGRITSRVKSIRIHPDWIPEMDSFDADIAVLELEEEVQFTSYIQPICLATPQSSAFEATDGIVVGFGYTEPEELSSVANEIKYPIQSYHDCTKDDKYHDFLSSRMFCGGAADGTGVCTGDSGAGIYILYNGRFYLRGIVSSSLADAMGECDLYSYSMATDVRKFYNWILNDDTDEFGAYNVNDDNQDIESAMKDCGQLKLRKSIFSKEFQPNVYPWNSALIADDGMIFCGGTLVSRKIVVTAAGCVKLKITEVTIDTDDFSILLGVQNLSNDHETGRKTFVVKAIHIHPDWETNIYSFDGDIAVLELEREVEYSRYIQPICLITPKSVVKEISEGIVLEVNRTESSKNITLKVPIKDYHDCSTDRELQKYISYRTFCGIPTENQCLKYPGYGVYVFNNGRYFLRGMFSANLFDCNGEFKKSKDSLFTDVAKFYYWIKNGGTSEYQTAISRITSLKTIESPSGHQMPLECGEINQNIPLVIGADDFVGKQEFPWNAALLNNDGNFFCGGSLISKKLVLTAAHCIKDKRSTTYYNAGDFIVVLGAHDLSKPYEVGKITAAVLKIYIHPNWNPHTSTYDSDIAILELEDEVIPTRFIKPICIPEPLSEPAAIKQGVVVGFGITESGTTSNIARKLKIPLISYHDCSLSKHHKYIIASSAFCGGTADGRGVCSGDSGSGVYVLHNGRYYLRGIVSTAIPNEVGECNVNTYSLFTDVVEFNPWIKSGGKNKYFHH